MTASPAELSVQLQAEPDTDDEELDRLARRLHAELLDLDVDAVRRPVREDAPGDAKGTGLLAAGELVVGLAASSPVLSSIIDAVKSWLGRNRARGVKLTLDGDVLEVSGVSSAEQDRLIDLWASRHGTG